MKKTLLRAAFAAMIIALLSSCVSTSKADKVEGEAVSKSAAKEAKTAKSKSVKEPKVSKKKFDEKAYAAAYEKGDYTACASMLLGRNVKKDVIKDMLDADMLMYNSEMYKSSGKGFLETYGLMQQSSAQLNAGEALKASLSVETNTNYGGAEYERYLAWSMRLACALNLDQEDVANGIMKDYIGTFMDEIQALRELNDQVEKGSEIALESDEFKSAQQKLSSSGINFSFVERPKKSSVRYETSPFFNYLGTLSYAANGDFDHAQQFADVYKVPKARELVSVPADKGRLEIVALTGLIGQREDVSAGRDPEKFVLHLNDIKRDVPIYTKITYPIFNPASQTSKITAVRISLSDGQYAPAVLIEDFDKAVAIDVAQKAYGAYSRSVFRNVVKNAIVVGSVIGAAVAVQQAAKLNALAAVAADIGLNTAIQIAAGAVAKIEKADTRQGIYFPNKASSAGFVVEPGTYSVKVEYLSGSSVVETKTIENIVVKPGKVTARVSSCQK